MNTQQNLVPLFSGLTGNTLAVGGTVISGFAILYLVRGVSTTLTNYIENLPKVFDDPSKLFLDRDTINIKRTFFRGTIILGSIAVGYMSRKLGNWLASPEGIASISSSLGYS